MPNIYDQTFSPSCKCIGTLQFGDEVYSEQWCTNSLTISILDIHSDTYESDNDESQALI